MSSICVSSCYTVVAKIFKLHAKKSNCSVYGLGLGLCKLLHEGDHRLQCNLAKSKRVFFVLKLPFSPSDSRLRPPSAMGASLTAEKKT